MPRRKGQSVLRTDFRERPLRNELIRQGQYCFSAAAAAGNIKTAYNILPQEKLKSQELAKEFSSTDWTDGTGISFVDGEAVFTDVVRYQRATSRDKILEAGKTYRVSFEIEDFVGEQVDSDGYSQDVQTSSKLSVQQVDNIAIVSDITKSGKYSALFTAKEWTSSQGVTYTSQAITFKVVSGSVSCKIKNVSVKEVRSKSNDFTLLRSSNLTATRVQADGKIEKGRQNFVLNSNRFDTDPWSISSNNGSLTSGQYGYDQSYKAWKFESTNAGGIVLEQTVTPTVDVCTWSFYVKNGPSNTSWSNMVCRVDFLDSEDFTEMIIDMSDGSLSHGGSQGGDRIGYESEAVGATGWYRISVSFSRRINEVKLISHNGTTTGVTVGDYVFIQNSQLEPGIAPTTYIDTDESEIAHCAGVLENYPRYDYTGNVNDDPVLMLEPYRQNHYEYSEAGSKNPKTSSPTITEKYADSPDGTKNAFRIQDSSNAGAYKRVNTPNIDITSRGDTFTFSVFVKKATSAVSTFGGAGINFFGGTQKIGYMIFDEYNGTAVSPSDSDYVTVHPVEDINGYWRFSFSWTDSGSNTSVEGILYACLSVDGSTVTTPTTKDYTAYGLQLEEGPYPTSYIPTHGSSAARSGEGHFSLSSFRCELAKPLTKSYTLFIDLKVDHLERDRNFDDIFVARRHGDDSYALRIEGYHDPIKTLPPIQ